MTIKTFWTILLKIIGLWFVFSFFEVAIQFVSTLFYFNKENGIQEITITVLLISLSMLIYTFLLWFFLFKTNWIINKLKLDKGFTEEKIDLNISNKTVLSITIIIIGGLLIIENFPNFCKQFFLFFQQKNIFRQDPNAGNIIFHFVKTIIGYILLTNSKFLANLISKKTETEKDEMNL